MNEVMELINKLNKDLDLTDDNKFDIILSLDKKTFILSSKFEHFRFTKLEELQNKIKEIKSIYNNI